MGSLHCHFMTGNLQPDDRLGDFTADRRVLTLTGMAALIGVISAFVALVLLRLIGFFTHLFYYHAIDSRLVSPADNRLGVWALLVPIVGGLIVGLMARYGSERIRGHGIPEALEAILIGQSRMSARVAVLKPLSSAISIGTGGPFGAEGPIIMTGGAFGSLFGQAFHLSSAERKTLLVAAAAGGMAAVFGTPLADTAGRRPAARRQLSRRAARSRPDQDARARSRPLAGRQPERARASRRVRGARRHLGGVGAVRPRRRAPRARLARGAIPQGAQPGGELAVARARRRLGGAPPVLLEPAHHVELRAHEVRRLRARAVVFTIEAEHDRRHVADLERRVVLLGLRNRRAPVELTRHEERRRGHAPDVHERRVRQPFVGLVPERLTEEAERE